MFQLPGCHRRYVFHICFIHQLLVSTGGLGPGGLVGIPRFVTESRIHFRGCHRNPNHQTPQTPQNHRALGKVQRGQTTLRLGPADLSFWGRLDVFTPQKRHFAPPRSDFWWFFRGLKVQTLAEISDMYIFAIVILISHNVPGTQMTPLLNGKGLLLESSNPKIEHKKLSGICTVWYFKAIPCLCCYILRIVPVLVYMCIYVADIQIHATCLKKRVQLEKLSTGGRIKFIYGIVTAVTYTVFPKN